MTALVLFLLLIPGAYLVGAVPWGLLIGKWIGGVDVRSTGSGNTGSSNVLRSAGAKPAILVLSWTSPKARSPSWSHVPSQTLQTSPLCRRPTWK
jgi:glycerol-3-phosphate acyltransferase PlsY